MKRPLRRSWFLWRRSSGLFGFRIPGATPPTVPFKSPPTFDAAEKPPKGGTPGH